MLNWPMLNRNGLAAALVVTAVLATPPPAWAAGGDPPPQATETVQAKKLIEAKDYGAALPLLRSRVVEAPGDADAWNLMGYATRKMGKPAEAEGYYAKALAIDNGHRGALEYLGELYLETGRPEKAKEMLARLNSACFFGCEEYDDLKKAIAAAERGDAGGKRKTW